MTIRELIKQLEQFSPNDAVFLSSDPEGNSIKVIHEVAELIDEESDKNKIVIWPSDEIVDGNGF